MIFVWLFIGVLLLLPLIWFSKSYSIDRANHFWGQALVIAAIIYVGLALFNGTHYWVAIEIFGVAIYGAFYWLGTRYSIIWVALGWIFHPIWDVYVHLHGPGHYIVPDWYAYACISFDVGACAYIVYLYIQAKKQR